MLPSSGWSGDRICGFGSRGLDEYSQRGRGSCLVPRGGLEMVRVAGVEAARSGVLQDPDAGGCLLDEPHGLGPV